MNQKKETSEPSAPRFAKNWVELAAALGTTRRTLQNWKTDPRMLAKIPKDRADGRKDIKAWREFVAEHALQLPDQDEDPDDGEAPPAGPPSAEFLERKNMLKGIPGRLDEWQKAIAVEKWKQTRAETQEIEGTLIPAAELEGPLGAVLVACTNFLTQLPERLGPEVVGFRNVHEVVEIIRAEVEAGLGALNAAAGYVNDAGELAAALPYDEETMRMFDLVEFAGMDRTPWREMIRACAVAVLRRVGARAIAAARAKPAAIAHEVTGQVTEEAEQDHALERAGSGRKKTKPGKKAAKPKKAAKKKKG